jgi:hypothetical protein
LLIQRLLFRWPSMDLLPSSPDFLWMPPSTSNEIYIRKMSPKYRKNWLYIKERIIASSYQGTA